MLDMRVADVHKECKTQWLEAAQGVLLVHGFTPLPWSCQ